MEVTELFKIAEWSCTRLLSESTGFNTLAGHFDEAVLSVHTHNLDIFRKKA